MSTQHPDNVHLPFFAESAELGGEDEIQEAYYAFSHLGCDEQMWDCEGKEVDNFVVKKLLSKYEWYFRQNQLGKDVFLTLRVPNPSIEKDEAKILLETLESIPRSFDTARLFYQDDVPPIFEVILPMTSSAASLDRIYRYYHDFVVGKQNLSFREGDITIAEWIGTFEPASINVIPLFEDLKNMQRSDAITREYLKDKDVEYQRVFLARSDPAMNYGQVSAILMNKMALHRLQLLEEELSIPICPIIGVGSAPFRGNLRPDNVDHIMSEYPSVQTFTVQSAFKFDYPHEQVMEGIHALNEGSRSKAKEVDEERCQQVIERCTEAYRESLIKVAPLINEVSAFVPRRRKRKLHIGLFGYSRSLEGVKLPRAIGFCCSFYSLGIPPEVLGLDGLSERDIDFIREVSPHFDGNMRDALRFMNPESMRLLPEKVTRAVEALDLDYQIDEEHHALTTHIMKALRSDGGKGIEEAVLRAANLRGFLG
ncbi:MAG: phosphoenolpyruvate carboxylase [Methanomassiliicoccaceae archaeon]|nr:phosphoenolpyruvate carboxylase [Methanomassiliicoccaceae archaeon]HQA20550.1 phosphoenolpyruvate carboxylase [Methanomassiliicoccaceae archaeon]HQD87136.1 phosphoenolpyruvate carboxylase [Methanomassiliicoccaceae archaeon]